MSQERLRERPWCAPWAEGKRPTRKQRQEFARSMAAVARELLRDDRPGHSPRQGLWTAWTIVFRTPEFREWYRFERRAFRQQLAAERAAMPSKVDRNRPP